MRKPERESGTAWLDNTLLNERQLVMGLRPSQTPRERNNQTSTVKARRTQLVSIREAMSRLQKPEDVFEATVFARVKPINRTETEHTISFILPNPEHPEGKVELVVLKAASATPGNVAAFQEAAQRRNLQIKYAEGVYVVFSPIRDSYFHFAPPKTE